MKSILDKSFRYVPAAKTNLKATFARIRRQQQEQASERESKVSPMADFLLRRSR